MKKSDVRSWRLVSVVLVFVAVRISSVGLDACLVRINLSVQKWFRNGMLLRGS